MLIAGAEVPTIELVGLSDAQKRALRLADNKIALDAGWDPDNANEALILLGIAEPDTRWNDPSDEYERLLLRPWAVQAALSRPGRRRFSATDIAAIERCTRDAHMLRWPAGVRHDQDD